MSIKVVIITIIYRLWQFWKEPNGNMWILSYKAFRKEKKKLFRALRRRILERRGDNDL